MKRMLILSPGPANISDRVRNALTGPDIGHREVEFSDLLTESRKLLYQVCGVPDGYACVVLSGSGTTAIESSITSLGHVTDGLLILSNGVYGERAAQIAEVFRVPFTLGKFEWTAPLPLDRVRELIRTTRHDVVYLVYHETTTGVLNPLREIAGIAKEYDKWVLVDAISSIAGEVHDLVGWGIDLITGSANKCIRGVPGVSFVILSNQLLADCASRRRTSYSNDLLFTLAAEERGETPFTPPVQVFYAFREALRELIEEGVENRIAHYREIARTLRNGLSNIGMSFLMPRDYFSNTMTSINLPDNVSYAALHSSLKKLGYVIYKSQGYLSDRSFRIGTVGKIHKEEIIGFLETMRRVLS